MLKIVCISDSHCQMNKITLPNGGDILFHAGDHTYRGTISEISQAMKDLKQQAKDYKYIVTIAGNHDWLQEHNPILMKQICEDNGIILLNHESIEIEGYKIFGSGYTPEFHSWALNVPRGEPLRSKWAEIPEDTEILLSHGPTFGILDLTPRGEHAGCEELYKRVWQLPKLTHHIFGHLHLNHGKKKIQHITFINASSCTEDYRPTNKPITFSLKDKK